MKKEKISQNDILQEYYRNNPNRNIPHPEVVDWVTSEFKKRTGKVFRDPDRQIRKLAQQGFLIKVSKGIYRYEPESVTNRILEDFTPAQKREILQIDHYKCVVCGKGEKDGVELHVDHIKPKELGGKATIKNGQTLCSPHNFLKKTLKQTETGKKMFIHLYKLAKVENDIKLINFCKAILEVYEKNDMNCHIKWKK